MPGSRRTEWEEAMERTVIRNAAVLSMDPSIAEHLDADVYDPLCDHLLGSRD